MTAPDNWGEQVAPRDVHTPPSEVQGAQLPSQDQMFQWGQKLIEGIVRRVVQLVTGILLPGPAGTQLTTWATGIFDKFGNISNLFGGANLASGSLNLSSVWSSVVTAFINPLGFFANLVSGFLPNSQLGGHDASKITSGTFANAFIPGLGSLISSLFGGSSILSQIQPSAVGGVTSGNSLLTDVSTFLTNIFNGITRQGASAASQDDALVAVAGQADTVVGTAATMEQIIAALGSGAPDADDFERASLGSAWTVVSTGSGSLSIPNSHDAKWSGTGSSSEFLAVKNDKQAATDHQTSTLVLATAIPSYPFFTPLPYGGYIDLWVRCTNFASFATRTGLRFRINGNPPYNASWYLDWMSSGTATNLGSGSMTIPGAGASLALEAGVAGNNRRFQARLNGTIISGADITEAGTTSQFGASYRYRGWGGKGNSGIGTAQGVPSIKQWTAQG